MLIQLIDIDLGPGSRSLLSGLPCYNAAKGHP